MTNDYVIVTTISTFKHRYVMHKNDLRKLNTDVEPTDKDLVEWAMDTVTMQEVKEFSQDHIGEHIVDHFECTEDEMLTFFDRDNDYLKSWTTEKKIEWVNDWRETYD